jgi:cytochrome P450
MADVGAAKRIQERRGIPVLGLAPEIQKRGGLVPILQEIHQEQVSQGKPAIYKLMVTGKTIIYVGEPHLIREIFHQPTVFDKPDAMYQPMRKFMLDHGLVTAQYAQWKPQRLHAKGSFSGRLMNDYGEIISAVASEVILKQIEAAKPNEVVDMDVVLARATSQALVKCMFNVDSGESPINEHEIDLLVKKLQVAYDYYFAVFFTPAFLKPLLRKMKKDFDFACEQVHFVLENVLNRYMQYIERNAITEPWDIISTFIIKGLNAPNPAERITFNEICGNVLTFLIAGFDTVASLIKTNMRYMWQYPDERRMVMDEITAVLGTTPPTFADLSKMPVLDNFINEALRYETPVSLSLREAVVNTRLGEYEISEGSLILLCQHIAHHDARFWKNPEVFDSSRFTREPKEPSNPYAYFPFTEGDRKCIGTAFGKMEAKIMTIQILQHGWNWTVTNPDAVGQHGPTYQKPLTLTFNRP